MITKLIAFIITANIFFSACTDETPIFNTENMVYCVMVNGETPKIILTRTLDAFPSYSFDIVYYNNIPSNEAKISMANQNMVYDRFFEVYDNTININYRISNANANLSYYTNSDIIATSGENYALSIEIADVMQEKPAKLIKANTNIPETVPFDLVQLDDVFYFLENVGIIDSAQVFKIAFNDAPNTHNYYYLLPYIVTLPVNQNIENIDIDSLWSNKDAETLTGDVALTPLSNLSYVDIIGIDGLDESGINLQGLLFNDDKFNGQLKEIILQGIPMNYKSNAEQNYYMFFELFNVTESYYTYYNKLLEQSRTRTDPYSEMVQAYTNIDNGVGLFAGVSIYRNYIALIP